jgi:hypothetical protein
LGVQGKIQATSSFNRFASFPHAEPIYLPLPDLVEFSGTKASKLIADGSLTFVRHCEQGSNSVLPSGAVRVSIGHSKISVKAIFKTQRFLKNQDL